MTLAKYIGDLLYRYECVIVPNFGGFITNEVSAKVNEATHTFYAPSKQITFNSHLQNSDGLLVHYVASVKSTSYPNAAEFIAAEVASWKSQLKTEIIELENIGTFKINKEGKYIFEPCNTVNYLTSSFGMNTYVSPAVKREVYKEKVKQLETIAPVLPSQENKRKTPAFLKYAATAAIVFALGSVGWNQYQNFEYNKLMAKTQLEQEQVEKKIQEATFVISNPLPAITLNVTKETYNFHIIAGAFREPENADKKLKQLIGKGYDAKILGVNKWNLTQVSYASFNSKEDAKNLLNSIQKNESKDAWLLVQEY